MSLRMSVLAVAVLSGLVVFVPSRVSADQAGPAPPASGKSPQEVAQLARERAELAAAPIHSKADLDAYLARTTATDSAFAPLSPEGYRQFINHLSFNEKGLSGFRISELHRELTPDQVRKILTLFGYQHMTNMIAGVDDGSSKDPRRPTPPPVGPVAKAALALEAVQRHTGLAQDEERARFVAIYVRDIAPLVTPARITQRSSDDLHEAIESTTFYLAGATDEPKYVADAKRELDELVRRKDAVPDDFRNVVSGFVYVRDVPGARDIARQGHLPTDSLVDIDATRSGGRGLLELDHDARLLVRHPFTLARQGTQILVVSSARCHFTVDAAEAIDANPSLKSAMASRSVWIAPPDGDLAVQSVKAWNAAHPAEHMSLIASINDWPELDTRATPQFFVFKNGVLVRTINGWRGEETEKALLKALDA